MASRIEVDAERVARRLARLHRMLRCSQAKHLGLYRLDIVDGRVKVKLLWPLARRPGWRSKLLSELERQSQTVDSEDDPVVLGGGDLPANNSPIEISQ